MRKTLLIIPVLFIALYSCKKSSPTTPPPPPASPVPVATFTRTLSPTVSASPTDSPTASSTPSETPSWTETPSPTATSSPTVAASPTSTVTLSPTATYSANHIVVDYDFSGFAVGPSHQLCICFKRYQAPSTTAFVLTTSPNGTAVLNDLGTDPGYVWGYVRKAFVSASFTEPFMGDYYRIYPDTCEFPTATTVDPTGGVTLSLTWDTTCQAHGYNITVSYATDPGHSAWVAMDDENGFSIPRAQDLYMNTWFSYAGSYYVGAELLLRDPVENYPYPLSTPNAGYYLRGFLDMDDSGGSAPGAGEPCWVSPGLITTSPDSPVTIALDASSRCGN